MVLSAITWRWICPPASAAKYVSHGVWVCVWHVSFICVTWHSLLHVPHDMACRMYMCVCVCVWVCLTWCNHMYDIPVTWPAACVCVSWVSERERERERAKETYILSKEPYLLPKEPNRYTSIWKTLSRTHTYAQHTHTHTHIYIHTRIVSHTHAHAHQEYTFTHAHIPTHTHTHILMEETNWWHGYTAQELKNRTVAKPACSKM